MLDMLSCAEQQECKNDFPTSLNGCVGLQHWTKINKAIAVVVLAYPCPYFLYACET